MIEPSTSRAEAFRRLRRAFAAAGLDTPALDARLLVAEALGIDAVELAARPDTPAGPEGAERLGRFAARRLAREPVDRILGSREFWSLEFALSPATLAPRPETETVVAAALSALDHGTAARRLLDFGTGSGCILVALLRELPQAWGIGIDRSPAALSTARANAVRNRVDERAAFVASDWDAALGVDACFDLIVSNPPYIPSGEIAGLAPEVRDHDPAVALDGGPDGLGAYRKIIPASERLLRPGGMLAVEIGAGQERAVLELAGRSRLAVDRVSADLAGHPRAIVLKRTAG